MLPRVLVCCLSIALATAAHAQDVEQLIETGLSLREQGRDADALSYFQRAHRVAPSGRTAAQLALTHQALGQWLEAAVLMRQALASGDPWVQQRRQPLDQANATIREHVGDLSVTGTPAGAQILLDGTQIATLPTSSPVPALVGRRELEVRMDGYAPFRVDVRIEPGQHTQQTVTLASRESGSSSTGSSSHGGGGVSYLWTFVLGGTALALAGATIALGVHTQSVYDGLYNSCGLLGCTDEQIGATGLEGAALATNVLLTASIAMGVATIVAFFVESLPGIVGARASLRIGPGSIALAGRY